VTSIHELCVAIDDVSRPHDGILCTIKMDLLRSLIGQLTVSSMSDTVEPTQVDLIAA
jgi:hypothetical protein